MAENDGEMRGKITPEGIKRFRNRIGVLARGGPAYNTEAHIDTMRHWCFGVGDDNPLYTDPEYAAKTRWKGLIGSPMYVMSLVNDQAPKIPDHVRKEGSGALTGVPNYQSGSDWEWVRPIREGDRINSTHFVEDVVEKKSQFGGGKAIIVYHRRDLVNQRGELVAVYRDYYFHVEREASEKTGKYMEIDQTPYTQEQLSEIDAAYEHEFRRGADTLYWEDVEPGMDMPTTVKGPLTGVDIISWHMGWGFGGFRPSPARLGYLNRLRIPAFYTKTPQGNWDVAQRVHWEDTRAKRIGVPRAYDYGAMRTAYIAYYCTNWMGDDGFLWKESDATLKFNYHGDVQWVNAKVTGKRQEEQRNIVDLELWLENQRGETTVTGNASVLLPSRTRGPVVIPAREVKPTALRNEFSVDIPGSVW